MRIAATVVAAALFAGPALGQGAKRKHVPIVRASFASAAATYDDASRNELKGRVGEQSSVALAGTDLQIAGVYDAIETELGFRQLTPNGVDHWKSRQELALIGSYYWSAFPWVRPAVGYFQSAQAGDQSVESAPPAFIDANRGLVFGVRTSFVPLAFDKHGVLLDARLDYLTSLEKRRNFGTQTGLELGYYFLYGNARIALFGGWTRDFFNATRPDPEDSAYLLQVRHVYQMRTIGLALDY